MKSKDYLKDLNEIKHLMNKSSRFMSLSGLSGILAGIYALTGAFFVNSIINNIKESSNVLERFVITFDSVLTLILIAFGVLFLSVITAIYLSWRKAKKHNESLWDATSKRLLINFMIPLTTGGFFVIFLVEKEMFTLVAPLTLAFYGLALVNASKYTLGYIRYLGITIIILSLISLWFIGYGLLFWSLGFGVCHIVYGTLMHFKYDKKQSNN
ncbi:MAG: hypothetical protein R2816_06175 [Flavobacteriaceae bacterium]|nr:hypothetical protein [Flavobacteriaceae bacterium]